MGVRESAGERETSETSRRRAGLEEIAISPVDKTVLRFCYQSPLVEPPCRFKGRWPRGVDVEMWIVIRESFKRQRTPYRPPWLGACPLAEDRPISISSPGRTRLAGRLTNAW